MHLKVVLGTAVLSGLLCANLSAAPITQFSTVNLSGVVTVSITGATQNILWFSDIAPNPANQVTTSGGTGDFAGTAGQNAIANLNSAQQPASTPAPPFVPITFLNFAATKASLPQLIINFLDDGVNGVAGCSAMPPAPGQLCTPGAPPPDSPFNFENLPNGGSSVSLTMSGVTSDGSATWTGFFTAQFAQPFQTILTNFANGGSVTNTYSATIIATPIPEAGTMLLLGLGLIGVSMRLRRRKI